MPKVVELNRRLVQGYEKYKDDQRIIELKNEVVAYNKKLRAFGLRDHQVQYAKMNPLVAAGTFFYRLAKLLFLSILVIPGVALFSLVFISTKWISILKAREALAASSVKVQARDVMATWKLLVAIFAAPAVYASYTIGGIYLYTHDICRFGLPEGIQKRYLAILQPILYVTITYGSLRFGEVAMDILKSLGPLWKAMNPFSNSELAKLQARREQLALRVNNIINELGPEMFDDFYSKRIIKDPFSKDADSAAKAPPPLKTDEDAAKEGPQSVETYDFPVSPTSPGGLPRAESFGDLTNQDIFSSRPVTPKKSRSRNASSADFGGFTLKPFSTLDGGLEVFQQKLSDGVKRRSANRRSSGVGSGYESEEEGLTMGGSGTGKGRPRTGTW